MTARAAPTVLVAVDHAGLGGVLAELLSAEGHRAVRVARGPVAVRAALRWRPDAVLLDLGLPDRVGWAVLEQCKTHPLVRAVPVVALCWQAPPARHPLAGVADVVLPKSAGLKPLLAAIRTLVGRRTRPGGGEEAPNPCT